MRDGLFEIGFRSMPPFDIADESFEAAKSIELFTVFIPADLRPIERDSQKIDGFIVGLQRHGKRMPVLSTKREGKPRRIIEAGRSAVNDLGYQGQRL